MIVYNAVFLSVGGRPGDYYDNRRKLVNYLKCTNSVTVLLISLLNLQRQIGGNFCSNTWPYNSVPTVV